MNTIVTSSVVQSMLWLVSVVLENPDFRNKDKSKLTTRAAFFSGAKWPEGIISVDETCIWFKPLRHATFDQQRLSIWRYGNFMLYSGIR